MIEVGVLVFVVGMILVLLLSPLLALLVLARWIGLRRLVVAACLVLVGIWLLSGWRRAGSAEVATGRAPRLVAVENVRPHVVAKPPPDHPLLHTARWPELDRVKFTADVYPSARAAVDSAVAQWSSEYAAPQTVAGAGQAVVVSGPARLNVLHDVAAALGERGFANVFVGASQAPGLPDARTIEVALQPAEPMSAVDSGFAAFGSRGQTDARPATRRQLTLTDSSGAVVNRFIEAKAWVEPGAPGPKDAAQAWGLVSYSQNLEPAPDLAVNSAIAVAADRIVTLLDRDAGSPLVAEAARRSIESILRRGELTEERFVQRIDRPYGQLWRAALLIDVGPEARQQMRQEIRRLTAVEAGLRKSQARRQVLIGGVGAISVALVTLAYVLVNAWTREYFRWPLRLASAGLGGACIVATVLLI